MSRTLELPDPLYAALEEAAAASGLTPAAWIAAHLPGAVDAGCSSNVERPVQSLAERFPGRFGVIDTGGPVKASEGPPQNLAEFLEGYIGVIDSGDTAHRSGNLRDSFADYLIAKRRAGRF